MSSNSDDDEDDERNTWWRSIKRSVRSVMFGLAMCGASSGVLLLSEGRAVRYGQRLDAIVAQAEDGDADAAAARAGEAPATWRWRGVAFGMSAVGLWMVLRPITTASNAMPLLGSIVRETGLGVTTLVVALAGTCGVIGLLWLEQTPAFGVFLLAASLSALAWMKTHADLRRGRRGQPHGTAKLRVLESVPRAMPA